MSESTHQIKIKASDQTTGAFKSIESNAKMTSTRINKLVGAAAATAAAFISTKLVSGAAGLVTGTVNEMTSIGEQASLASISVEDLTRATAALGTIGIKGANLESFSKALATMQKTTGKQGLSGFYETIDALNEIESTAERANKASQAFGDFGLSLMPLIESTDQTPKSLKSVVDMMPSLGNEATSAATSAQKAMELFNTEIKYGFMQMLGDIVGSCNESFNGPDGLVVAAAIAANNMFYFFQRTVNKTITLWDRLRAGFELAAGTGFTFVGAMSTGASFSEAYNLAKEDFIVTQAAMVESIFGAYDARKTRIDSSYEQRLYRLNKLAEQLKKLRSGLGKDKALKDIPDTTSNGKDDKSGKQKSETKQQTDLQQGYRDKQNLSNSLILDSTAEALKLSVLGPQTQNELKKQTGLLQQIKENTRSTAANTSSTEKFTEVN